MSRSWKQERTTPKGTIPVVSRKPRMSDEARKMYTDRGYIVEIPEVDTQCLEPGCTGSKCESCF